MLRKATIIVVLGILAVAASFATGGDARADRGDRGDQPAALAELLAVSFGEGMAETPGFNPAGFQGDLAVVLAQAASPAAPTVTYCKTSDFYRYGTNIFGQRLWEFHHAVYFCFDPYARRIIGTPTTWSWGVVKAPGWDYKGEIGSQQYWMSYPGSYFSFRQGKFQLCYQWCVQTTTPWVRLYIYGSGIVTAQTGG